MNESSLPSVRSRIGEALGLYCFRVGERINKSVGRKKREEWITAHWDMTFLPAFDDPGTLAVVSTSLVDDDFSLTPASTYAVLICGLRSFVQKVDADPVTPLLVALPILSLPTLSDSRDGHGCRLQFTTTHLDMVLAFCNPVLSELRNIEEACLKLAEQVAESSEQPQLQKATAIWKRYISGA